VTGEALVVRGLCVEYPRRGKLVRAVDGVDLELTRGEIHALAGESGSGKSSLGLALLGLVRSPGRTTAGRMHCAGREADLSDPRSVVELRGRVIALLLQESKLALDPLQTVERQILDGLRRVHGADASSARAEELLARVGFEAPHAVLRRFPHELSGGMRQRAQLAAALALEPRYLVADEPTASLDAVLARQVLELLSELCRRDGLGVLLVTHDLAAAASVADRLSVMYAGAVVESGAARDVLLAPRHPYTAALVDSVAAREPFDRPLAALPGRPPEPGEFIAGCAFSPRCGIVEPSCGVSRPQLRECGPGRVLACPPRARGAVS